MGTILLLLNNSYGALSGLRIILFAVFMVFSFCTVRSQTTVESKSKDKQTVLKGTSQDYTGNHLPSAILLSVPVQKENISVIHEPLGVHAPGISDADYDAKKAEWIMNYPDEYNDYLIKSIPVTCEEVVRFTAEATIPVTYSTDGIAEHAPALDDPEYKTKKELWIQKYPDEYRAALCKPSGQYLAKANGDPAITATQDTENLQKTAVHAPALSDPDYETKKEFWVQNYPDEYKACLENKTTDNRHIKNSMNQEIMLTIPKISGKVAEHAPELTDPDYTVKKSEWIKNYPGEYITALKNNPDGNFLPTTDLPVWNEIPKSKSTIKLPSHAPALNDPDYQAKKEEWIKRYPKEYQQAINPVNYSVQNK